MKKLIIIVSIMAVFFVGCSRQKFSSRIETNGHRNENKINYGDILNNIDQEDYDQASNIIEDLKKEYPDDYMLNQISLQIESYLKAEYNVVHNRDWEVALNDLAIFERNSGSKRMIMRAKKLYKKIDTTKITYDAHLTERDKMFQAGATQESIGEISDQEINRILKLSKNKGEPEPHKGEYFFIETMGEEHPELNMSIKNYEQYWSGN